MLGDLVSKLGVPLLTQTLSGALETIDHPAARQAAEALDSLDGEVQRGGISRDALQAASREMARLKRVRAETHGEVLKAINDTIQVEAQAEDPYVRRMRPTFGYILALSWLAQMGAVAYTIVSAPGRAGSVIGDIAQLSTMWSVGLSVLGVYVYKRSQEKGVSGSGSPVQALKSLASQLAGSGQASSQKADGGRGAR